MSNSSQNSVQAKSLWIGEIEYWMDEGFIIKLFQDVANVKNLKIIRDKIKSSNLGYGFIEFDTSDTAREVLEEMNGKPIPDTNKTLKLNWASYSAGKQAAMSNAPVTDYSIYVGDLESSINEEKLKDFFSKYYSSVIGTKIIIDPVNKFSKGYGFVKFADQSEAQRAINEMSGKYLNGKQIKTNQASFKKMNSESNLLSNSYSQFNYSNNNSSGFNNYSSEYGGSLNNNLFSYNQMNNYNSTGNNSNKFSNCFNQNQTSTPSTKNTPTNNSLTNLNNFYIQNPNVDYSLDSTNAGGNYNLNNFYYNNLNNPSYYNNMYSGYYNMNYNTTSPTPNSSNYGNTYFHGQSGYAQNDFANKNSNSKNY